MKKIFWKDVDLKHQFKDGSIVEYIHETHNEECYRIDYAKLPFLEKSIIVSEDHLLLCDISHFDYEAIDWVKDYSNGFKIALKIDRHVYSQDLESIEFEKDEVVEYDDIITQYDNNGNPSEVWLSAKAIYLLIGAFHQKIYCNGFRLKNAFPVGPKPVFCVGTDTHRFEVCGLIHHNSVALRNIILHCLTHQDEIAIALIDLKWTEFSFYKGMKNVVAVANTVQEAVEIMRIAKEVMYKRNQEMSKLSPPINDIKDYKPKNPTDKISVFGRIMDENVEVEIKLPPKNRFSQSEIKRVPLKEVKNYL